MATPKTFVLGAGAIGSLVAHELCLSAPRSTAPTLLFRNQSRLNRFAQDGGELIVSHRYSQNHYTTRSRLNLAVPPSQDHPLEIDNLIVVTKTYQTIAAIEPYISSLSPDANIVILQNGMGMARKLNARYWSNSPAMPNLFEAITTHGAFKSAPNVVQHAAEGKILMLRFLDPRSTPDSNTSLPSIITDMIGCTRLNASYVDRETFLPAQMEKLIVNACINPLTAIYDCLNGDLLLGSSTHHLMRRVVWEAAQCFKAEYPELAQSAELRSAFDIDRLMEVVMDVCKATAMNSSSMREDIRHLNVTEISSFNGYIASLGAIHNVSTPTNALLVQLVRGKSSITRAVEAKTAASVIEGVL